MTNFEKYKDDIIQICTSTGEIPAVLSDKVADCEKSKCTDCLLFEKPKDNCSIRFILWLYEEYKEPIKLTSRELKFLEVLETGWIARDGDDNLYWFSNKPIKTGFEITPDGICDIIYIHDRLKLFDFISTGDKPYSVEEMLRWDEE